VREVHLGITGSLERVFDEDGDVLFVLDHEDAWGRDHYDERSRPAFPRSDGQVNCG
jgi:hypothetical protein